MGYSLFSQTEVLNKHFKGFSSNEFQDTAIVLKNYTALSCGAGYYEITNPKGGITYINSGECIKNDPLLMVQEDIENSLKIGNSYRIFLGDNMDYTYVAKKMGGFYTLYRVNNENEEIFYKKKCEVGSLINQKLGIITDIDNYHNLVLSSGKKIKVMENNFRLIIESNKYSEVFLLKKRFCEKENNVQLAVKILLNKEKPRLPATLVLADNKNTNIGRVWSDNYEKKFTVDLTSKKDSLLQLKLNNDIKKLKNIAKSCSLDLANSISLLRQRSQLLSEAYIFMGNQSLRNYCLKYEKEKKESVL